MKVTRRDALAAVAASTGGIVAVGELAERFDAMRAAVDGVAAVRPGLVSAARVVFPSEVEPTDSFVQTYVIGREYDQSGYVDAAGDALTTLDRESRRRFGTPFADLDPARGDDLLRSLGVADVPPDSDGTSVERIRYYVVNELLYALFTSPTGGQLLGNENPPGYPGGRDAYRQGPTDE